MRRMRLSNTTMRASDSRTRGARVSQNKDTTQIQQKQSVERKQNPPQWASFSPSTDLLRRALKFYCASALAMKPLGDHDL